MRAAVLGTGIMGSAMARSLAREGHGVSVWNRTPERADAVAGDGITAHHELAEAVADVDVVLTVLFDTASVLAITDELVAALPAETVWAQVSTVGVGGIRAVRDAAGAAADRLVDAPVLGTKAPAEQGTLVVLASGPAAAREQAGPAFDAIGSRTLAVGDEVGPASALKLVVNAWVASLNASLGQSLALAESLGLEPQLFLDAIGGGPTDTPYAGMKGALMISRDWDDPAFALDSVRKDVGLIVDAASSSGLPTGLLDALREVYDDAAATGHGGHDMSAVRAAFDGADAHR